MTEDRLIIYNNNIEMCRETGAYFRDSGYYVISCSDPEELMAFFSKEKHLPDLLIYYVDQPDRKSYRLLEAIRNVSELPIIMVSKDVRLDVQLYAYSKRIDDYLPAPAPYPLVEAHVEAIMRRVGEGKPSVETVGALTINYDSRKIYLNGRSLKLTAKEFDLMEYFVKHRGMILSRDQLLDYVWGFDYIGGYRCVDTLIKKIRAKLTKEYPYIHTSYGIGYSFEIPEETEDV